MSKYQAHDENSKTKTNVCKRLHFCIDFDKTITLHDTTSALLSLSLSSPLRSVSSQTTATNAWNALSEYYTKETEKVMSHHLRNYINISKQVKVEMYHEKELMTFLQEYHYVDTNAIQGVIQHRLFYGSTLHDIQALAFETRINNMDCMFMHLLEYIEQVDIISLNWSTQFLQYVLWNDQEKGVNKQEKGVNKQERVFTNKK